MSEIPGEGTGVATIADKIRSARLPTRTVEICLETELQDRYEDLERQLAAAEAADAKDRRLGSGAKVREIAQQITDLLAEMRQHVVEFRLQALSKRAWSELMKAHPGRDEKEDQEIGYNPDTFFDAVIKACTLEPQLDDEIWDLLLGERLTAHQYNTLQSAVLALNVRRVSVPNSLAASRILRDSEPE